MNNLIDKGLKKDANLLNRLFSLTFTMKYKGFYKLQLLILVANDTKRNLLIIERTKTK
jgi:hypothetical protein